MARVLILVGTRKGAFLLSSDEERRHWEVEGPFLKGWEVQDLSLDARPEPGSSASRIYAAVGHVVYGASIRISRDFGASWEEIEEGPSYDADSGRTLEKVWCVVPGHASEPRTLWAGVAEAGLFVSRDGGRRWLPVSGLNDQESRKAWSPGAGGLCCHTVAIDPRDARRMWVGISAVGVFRSEDGGETWAPSNEGLPIVVPSEDFADVGTCVHKLVVAPDDPETLYQQNHRGVFRSRDSGVTWQRIETGLPSTFGFPIALHPQDSRTLYTIPLESDEYRFPPDGRLAVYRSRDAGESWQVHDDGLPSSCYSGILRNALAVDGVGGSEGCGVYFGTTGGQIFYSRDAGESWQSMPCILPRISSVTAAVIDG